MLIYVLYLHISYIIFAHFDIFLVHKRSHSSYNKMHVLFIVTDCKMGCFGSKDKLSKEDMDFLKSHTRYDEATIKEWYKGFKVSIMIGYMLLEVFFFMMFLCKSW